MSEVPDSIQRARPGCLTDSEIKAALPAASGQRRRALQAELDERQAWRTKLPEPAELTTQELIVEALRLWHQDPERRPERYQACVDESERRRLEARGKV